MFHGTFVDLILIARKVFFMEMFVVSMEKMLNGTGVFCISGFGLCACGL